MSKNVVELVIDPEIGRSPSHEESKRAHVIRNMVEDAARLFDLVITVEQVPLEPLAMGHYKTVVSVRRAIDHVGEAAKRGGYEICAHCKRAAGQGCCDWAECDGHSPREVAK